MHKHKAQVRWRFRIDIQEQVFVSFCFFTSRQAKIHARCVQEMDGRCEAVITKQQCPGLACVRVRVPA